MRYHWIVRSLKIPRVNLWWRWWLQRRGTAVGNYGDLPDLIRRHAPGRSFADVGCMWGVNGEYAFIAEEAGATRVVALDVFGPTPEFDEKKRARGSSVEFVLGNIVHAETMARVGAVDVVFCAGVLYHHPSPFDLLVALRRICTGTLILRTASIPEVPGMPNAAVFYPMLDTRARALWDLRGLGVLHQTGISNAFQPEEGYGNWFWGLTPSCLVSMLRTAGFRVQSQAFEAFAHTVVCTAVAAALAHRLPDEGEARRIGADVSRDGIARPA